MDLILPVTLREDSAELQWRTSPGQAARERLRLLFFSLANNLEWGGINRAVVVSPADDLEPIRVLLDEVGVADRWDLVDEHSFCPELAVCRTKGMPIPGWYLQQILKLAAARVLNSPFYLTLDSDVICRKRIGSEDLCPGGRALLNVERVSDFLRLYRTITAVREWRIKCRRYRVAEKLLKLRRPLSRWFVSYGETPVMMHRQSVCDMLDRLGGDRWVEILGAARRWTEYSLLFVYMEAVGTLDTHYSPVDARGVLDLYASAWKVDGAYRSERSYLPETLLKSGADGGPFLAMQSYLPESEWLPEEFPYLEAYYGRWMELIRSNQEREA